MTRRSTLALFALSVFAVAAEPPAPVHESAEVTLVTVPVTVLGRDGKPVRGLGAADFELEDDGVAQTVLSVDTVDLTRRGTDADASVTPPAGRRHFLFLFDLSFSKPPQIVHAREAAARFIEKRMDPEDLAAVATTSVDTGARMMVTFTADRRQLVAAIRSVGIPRGDEITATDPLQFAFVVPGDPAAARGSAIEQSRRADSRNLVDPGTARAYTVMAQRAEDHFAVNRVERHLTEIEALSHALNTIEGRKTIVYFSEGFNGRLLLGSLARQRSAQDTQADNDAIMAGRFTEVDREHRNANPALQRHLEGTIEMLRRSDCTVYAIDLSGVKVDGDDNLGPEVHGGDELFAFADGTGGEVLKNSNDFESQMRRISDKTSFTYVLAFRPSKKSGSGRFHRLRVRTRVKGARVAARAGYYESRQFRSLDPLERSLSAADVITHERTEDGFPMSVMVLPLEAQPLARVPVLVEIPGSSLLADGARGSLRLSFYVYAVSDTGEVADFFARSVVLDLEKQAAALRAGPFRYCGSVRVLAGHYRIRVLVRDDDRGRTSFRVTSIDVPEASSGSLRSLPPLFLGPEGEGPDGVSVSEPAVAESAPVTEIFEIGGTGFLPRLRPELRQGAAARLCVMLYSHGQKSDGAFQIEARVHGPLGRSIPPPGFVVLGRSSPDPTGLQKLLVEFTPPPLPPGDYSLTLTLRGDGDARGTPSQSRFRIL